MWITPLVLASLVLAVSAGGCGASGGGSGVDRSHRLDELTTEEAADICDAALDLVSAEDRIRVNCYIGAIALSIIDPSVDCEITAEGCIGPPEHPPVECEVSSDTPPACASMVTVGEFEDCKAADAAQVTKLADTVSCESDLEAITEKPPACAAIEAKCPSLLDGE